MEMILHDVTLPLRHTFTIAHQSSSVDHDIVVELRDGGVSGYGEAATLAYYGITLDDVRRDLEAARKVIEADNVDDPVAFWERMKPILGKNRFAMCGLDQAAYDLWGKKKGSPVWKLWGLNLDKLPLSDYTIGIDSIERMVEKMNEFPNWPIYKIKLGAKEGAKHDIEIMRALREHTKSIFRVDANCGWSADDAIMCSHELKKLGVEFIEQPLHSTKWEDQKRVFAESALPIIADESCCVEEDVEKCVGYFHGINIKLTKAGGLTPARRMIETARKNNLSVMVGCMTESSVGISAIAQLLPLIDYVDMDGILLISKDVAKGVRLEQGKPIMPTENGNGVTWLGS